MRVKKVPLQDLELWPDEVICFTAYTDTRNPFQQRRTYVDGKKLKAENAKLYDDLLLAQRIIGQISHEGFELIDDNEKIRDLAKYAILCSEGDVLCVACPYHKDTDSYVTCSMRAAAIDLDVELPA